MGAVFSPLLFSSCSDHPGHRNNHWSSSPHFSPGRWKIRITSWL